MKKYVCILLALLPLWLAAQNTSVRINEVDPDQPGTDTKEFVELYGPANASLDGLVLVLFNGAASANSSYSMVDLAGYSLNGQGFFLVATQPLLDSVGMTGAVLPVLAGQGDIQNGADGIALYAGNASNWPSGTAVTADNLIDAIVYGSNDPDATGLISVLVPGQAQLNDSGNSTTSFSRFPDGGPALNHASFVVQAPTPGLTNGALPACLAGALSSLNQLDSICIESSSDTIAVAMAGALGNVIYALTVAGQVVDTSSTGIFIFETLALVDYQAWGIAYTDGLVLSPGMLVDSIDAACISISAPLSFSVLDCVPNCNAGSINASLESAYVLGNTIFAQPNLSGDGSQLFLLTDMDGVIILSSTDSAFTLPSLPIGAYQLWGANYDGEVSGDSVNANLGDVNASCWALSVNYVSFDVIDSSSCAITSFSLPASSFCQQTDTSFVISSEGVTGEVLFFITNLDDSILQATRDTVDLNSLGNGDFRVYALAYDADDTTHYELWDTLPNVSDSDCPRLYEALAFSYGFCPCEVYSFSASTDAICIEDAPVSVTFESEVFGNVLYGIAQDSIILAVFTDSITISDYPIGDYQFFAIAYFGEIPSSGLIGNSIENVSFDSCSSFSSLLPISVIDCLPNCYADGMTVVGQLNHCDQIDYGPIEFTPDSVLGNWIVYRTDSTGGIIEPLPSQSFNADNFANGIYYFQAIAYSGTLIDSTSQAGDAVSAIQSNDCVAFFDTTIVLTITACEFSAPCSELFFSEYLEGSSFNKAIEIYNPTPFAVDLSAYKVESYNNGVDSSASNTLALTGVLESGDVFVIANGQATGGILALADTTSSVANFNGDDALVLLHDNVRVDIIGIVGQDPGTNWSVVGGATSNNTLVRNPDFNAASTDWNLLQTQWTVYPNDDTTHLGFHESVGCTIGPNPCIVSFTSTSTDSSATLQINANEPNQTFLIEWGDGTTNDQNTLTHTYASAGYYEVCISATDTSCDFQYCDIINIGIECAIDVVITENDPLVNVVATELATGSGVFEISWGAGMPAVGENVSFEYAVSGNYQVCVTYSDTVFSQCEVVQCENVSVVVPASCNAELVVVPGINVGEYVATINGTGAMDPVYFIDWGNGSTSNTMSATYIYGPGTFDITATYGDANVGGCYVELGPISVTIESLCSAEMGITAAGNVVGLTPSTVFYTAPVYTIDWGDGVVTDTMNIESIEWHEYNNPGTYTITVNVMDIDVQFTGCGEIITQQITVLASGGNCPVQLGTSSDVSIITATAEGPADGSYIIEWGDGTYSLGSTAQHAYQFTDTFTVCVHYTSADGSCSFVDCSDVIVNEVSLCQVEILGYTAQGLSAQIELSVVNSSNTVYAINWGDGTIDSTFNTFHIYSSPGTYPVTVTITDMLDPSCFAQAQINITVEEIISSCDVTLTVTPQQDGSYLAVASGSGGSSSSTYSISWGDGTIPDLSDSAVHTYAASGTFQICVTYADVSIADCFATACENVTGLDEINAASFSAVVYPNPLQASSVLELTNMASSQMEITLWDALGRRSCAIYSGSVAPGILRLSIPSNLNAGIYTLRIRNEREQTVLNVIQN